MKIIIDNKFDENIRKLREFKGFVTIATGNEKYTKMAYILMKSYKIRTKSPCRFAIITDIENDLTKEFDDIIIYENANKSYMDKISLLIYAPYRENIFIDADSIIYGDLNRYWEIFSDNQVFSAFGRNLSEDSKEGWYKKENLVKYKDKVKNVIDIHGGIYYIKPGIETRKMYILANEIINDYNLYNFNKFKKPADEPILALVMAINGFKAKTPSVSDYVWLKNAKRVYADFFKGKLLYHFDNKDTDKGILIHFGTSYTVLPLYKIESKKVLFYNNKKRAWNIWENLYYNIKYFALSIFLCLTFIVKKILKKIKI